MPAKTVKGNNDLLTWCNLNNRLDLLEEWDPSNSISPDQISYGSHKIVRWICKNGHHYEKAVHARCQGTGCSICSGVNFEHRNRLFEEYPALVCELDVSKNDYDSVKNITSGSAKRISWICENGHTYEMSAANRIRGKGCPYCNNKRVLAGYNDLETWCKNNGRPQILADWDYKKNTLLPSEVTHGSNKNIWFKCHICGYEWQTVVNSRTYQGSDCKMCSSRARSSFPEQCVFYYVSLYFPDTINGDRSALGGRELDIWIPSLKTAVEYDGKEWHKNKSRDIDKDRLCKEKNIFLYRVRESGCEILDYKYSIVFQYDYGNWSALSEIISTILLDLGVNHPNVDVSRDEYLIKERYYKQSLDNSLQNLYPNLAKEWHPTKNKSITPDLVSAETHDQYYWLCPQGHTYKASPKNRVRMNSNCPYCAGQKILKGFNDLETTHPSIAIDYDNDKNERKSYEIGRGCSDYCWFKCHKCGYEFYYQLSTYVNRGGKCPVCSSGKTKFQKVLKWETQELFDTLPLAAKSIEPTADDKRIKSIYKNIYNSCNGKTSLAYGFHWFYVNVDKDGNIIDDLESLPIKNTDKHILGQSKEMNNGQTAVVIQDEGHNNIDIQFEDGTVVHTNRQSFRKGCVRNPNFTKKQIDNNPGMVENNIPRNIEKSNKNLIIKANKKSIVGKTVVMKSGERATCIKDNGWNDIAIQFEDDTVVEHISRQQFNKGSVEKPNYIFSFLGKEKIMNCGLSCKIICAISKSDISVQFENGDIVEHTSLSKFQKGTILTNSLSHNYRYITGTRRLMKCGLYATVIADRGAHDIDVEFEDGTKVFNKDRANFNRGNISIPRNSSILGMTKVMNNGMSATVIADNGWDNIDIQFENGVIVKHRRREHFKKGSISP